MAVCSLSHIVAVEPLVSHPLFSCRLVVPAVGVKGHQSLVRFGTEVGQVLVLGRAEPSLLEASIVNPWLQHASLGLLELPGAECSSVLVASEGEIVLLDLRP